MTPPMQKADRAKRTTGFRPTALDRAAKTGWTTAEHKTKLVPTQKPAFVVAWRSKAMV